MKRMRGCHANMMVRTLRSGLMLDFLLRCLIIWTDKEVTLQLSEPNRAGLIVPKEKVDNEDILMLVMPVMLSDQVG